MFWYINAWFTGTVAPDIWDISKQVQSTCLLCKVYIPEMTHKCKTMYNQHKHPRHTHLQPPFHEQAYLPRAVFPKQGRKLLRSPPCLLDSGRILQGCPKFSRDLARASQSLLSKVENPAQKALPPSLLLIYMISTGQPPSVKSSKCAS